MLYFSAVILINQKLRNVPSKQLLWYS